MRRFMIRWQTIEDSDDIIIAVGYAFNWFERMTGDRQGPRRFSGRDLSWRCYPGGGSAETWESLWLAGLYPQLVSWRSRIDARAAREQAALAALTPRPRTPQEITDAEVVAAANEMLRPQACTDPGDGTFPKYHELDVIAQQEFGYQVAVAIAAAEAARFASPGSSPASSHP